MEHDSWFFDILSHLLFSFTHPGPPFFYFTAPSLRHQGTRYHALQIVWYFIQIDSQSVYSETAYFAAFAPTSQLQFNTAMRLDC
jgi:hypothetical protein